MGTIKWESPTAGESVLSTALNALADAANKITATAISNDAAAELDLYGDFTLLLAAQASARDTGARVDLYILPRSDGTNCPYGGDALTPSSNQYVGSFLLDATVTARYEILRGIVLPPMDFHVLLKNATGQALAATGNSLAMRRYNLDAA